MLLHMPLLGLAPRDELGTPLSTHGELRRIPSACARAPERCIALDASDDRVHQVNPLALHQAIGVGAYPELRRLQRDRTAGRLGRKAPSLYRPRNDKWPTRS